MKRLIYSLPLLFTVTNLLAQTATPEEASTPGELSGKAAGALVGVICLFWIVAIAIWLFIAIWIMRDAKKRQSPNATLVTVLGWIPATTVIGLIVHLVTRPKTIPSSTTNP
jgi:L-asparagine transporter-like permease